MSAPRHDHRACRADARAGAERAAAAAGIRLTPLRLAVLDIVTASHVPLGAYEIMDALGRREGRRIAPPTVYRALETLMALGAVHRIDSRNAYVACFAPGGSHTAYFLLCEGCGTAEEIDDPKLAAALARIAERARFAARRESVEIAGRCAACAAR